MEYYYDTGVREKDGGANTFFYVFQGVNDIVNLVDSDTIGAPKFTEDEIKKSSYRT